MGDARIAVIGDVSGYAGRLQQLLRRLGADIEQATLPPDLIVVQVGDLVHKGPDSERALTMVDAFIRKNEGR